MPNDGQTAAAPGTDTLGLAATAAPRLAPRLVAGKPTAAATGGAQRVREESRQDAAVSAPALPASDTVLPAAMVHTAPASAEPTKATTPQAAGNPASVAPDAEPAVPAASGDESATTHSDAQTAQVPLADTHTIPVKVQTVDHGQPNAAVEPDRAVGGASERFTDGERRASADHRDDSHGAAHDKDRTEPATPSPIPVVASTIDANSAQATAIQAASPATSAVPPGSAGTGAVSGLGAPAADLATTSTAPSSPVGQLAPALLKLSTGSDGTQQMSLRLQPEELGVVEVRIDRAPDGTARVSVTADNPDTLQMLSGAQSDLHKALDAAGISASRTLTFALAPESRTLPGLSDLPSRPVGDDGSASQQSAGGGSGNATAQGGGGSGNASGSMAGSGSPGSGAGGNGASGSGGSPNDGNQGWASYAPAFQTVTDQIEVAEADNAKD